MANAKLVKLVLALEKGTREGTVAWEEAEEDDTYQASFPGYSIRVSQVSEGMGPTPHIMLFNDSGRLMEDMTGNDFSGYMEDAGRTFCSIFEMARNKAMGVDEAVDVILQSLPDPYAKPEAEFRDVDFGGEDTPF